MRIVLFLLLLLTFIACGKKNKVPKNILSQEKMETVVWDVIQADEFLKDYILNKDSTLNDTVESIKMYDRVFRLNNTTRDEFSRSFQYYTSHTALMKELLDSLNVRGQKESEFASRPKPVIDSNAIRKIRPTPATQ